MLIVYYLLPTCFRHYWRKSWGNLRNNTDKIKQTVILYKKSTLRYNESLKSQVIRISDYILLKTNEIGLLKQLNLLYLFCCMWLLYTLQ